MSMTLTGSGRGRAAAGRDLTEALTGLASGSDDSLLIS